MYWNFKRLFIQELLIFIYLIKVKSDDVYGIKGNSVELLCPINRDNGFIRWSFFANESYMVFTYNDELSQALPEDLKNRLTVTGDHANGVYNLKISNIRESDEGQYECNNLENNYVQSLHLIVVPTGLNLSYLENGQIRETEGQNLTITCTATGGQPPPNMTLTVGSTTTSGNQSVSYSIPILQRSHDRQAVRCQANSLALNTPMIKEAMLYLYLKPTIPIFNEDKPIANETQKLITSCTSTGSRPAAVFYWKLNQGLITTGITQQNISDPVTETYNVTSTLNYKVDRSYNGKTITCGVTHKASSVETSHHLSVYYAPDVNVSNKTYTKNEELRTMSCSAAGNPSTYTFYKWQQKSKYGEHIRFLDGGSTGILTLPNVSNTSRYQDTGEYVCTVSNGIGDVHGHVTQSTSGNMLVKAQPVVTDKKTDEMVYEKIEKDVSIITHVYSIPKYTVVAFKKDGKAVQSSKYIITDEPAIVNTTFHNVPIQNDGYRVSLTIKDLEEIDFDAQYSLQFTNEFGLSQLSTFILKLASGPLTPRYFSIISSWGSSVVVQWIPGYSGGATQSFYVQYRQFNTSGGWHTVKVLQINIQTDIQQYTVPDLQQNIVYEFRMYSVNKYNKSKYTDIKRIRTVMTEVSVAESINKGTFGAVVGCLVFIIVTLVIVLLKYKAISRLLKRNAKGKSDKKTIMTYSNITGDSTYDEVGGQHDQIHGADKTPEKRSVESNVGMYEMLGEKTSNEVYEEIKSKKDVPEKII